VARLDGVHEVIDRWYCDASAAAALCETQVPQRAKPGRFSFLSRLASRFSFRDLPGFLPAGFCGDFSGMAHSFFVVRRENGLGSRGARSAASNEVATPTAESPMPKRQPQVTTLSLESTGGPGDTHAWDP
jgi:hypothetical protein